MWSAVMEDHAVSVSDPCARSRFRIEGSSHIVRVARKVAVRPPKVSVLNRYCIMLRMLMG
jgi:hypothetical protein